MHIVQVPTNIQSIYFKIQVEVESSLKSTLVRNYVTHLVTGDCVELHTSAAKKWVLV